jgi:hypothetical protein
LFSIFIPTQCLSTRSGLIHEFSMCFVYSWSKSGSAWNNYWDGGWIYKSITYFSEALVYTVNSSRTQYYFRTACTSRFHIICISAGWNRPYRSSHHPNTEFIHSSLSLWYINIPTFQPKVLKNCYILNSLLASEYSLKVPWFTNVVMASFFRQEIPPPFLETYLIFWFLNSTLQHQNSSILISSESVSFTYIWPRFQCCKVLLHTGVPDCFTNNIINYYVIHLVFTQFKTITLVIYIHLHSFISCVCKTKPIRNCSLQ